MKENEESDLPQRVYSALMNRGLTPCQLAELASNPLLAARVASTVRMWGADERISLEVSVTNHDLSQIVAGNGGQPWVDDRLCSSPRSGAPLYGEHREGGWKVQVELVKAQDLTSIGEVDWDAYCLSTNRRDLALTELLHLLIQHKDTLGALGRVYTLYGHGSLNRQGKYVRAHTYRGKLNALLSNLQLPKSGWIALAVLD